jgi:cysteine desulfurase/selenocysteine lyase
MPTMLDCRAAFPVLQRRVDAGEIIYLDNAATTLKPTPVIDAVINYYTTVSANIHRGKHILSEEASDRYEQVRAQVASFLGTAPRNVVFTANTTDGLNKVASSLPVRETDLVVLPLDSHHSAQLSWRQRSRTAWIEAGEQALVDEDSYRRLLAWEPKVVVLTACSNVTGYYIDVDRLVAMAHQAGAFTVVDAAQLVPHHALRVCPEVDAVAFSAHKMLGPTGIGVLYLSDRLIDAIGVPTMLGGGTVDWVDSEDFRIRRPPYRFEAGTPDIAGVYGFGAALSYLDALGAESIQQHDQELLHTLVTEAAARPHLTVVGGLGEQFRAPIISVLLHGVDEPTTVARCLSDAYGVMCRSGFFCAQPYFERYRHHAAVRLSPYVYNTADEIRQAFTALDAVWRFLRRD